MCAWTFKGLSPRDGHAAELLKPPCRKVQRPAFFRCCPNWEKTSEGGFARCGQAVEAGFFFLNELYHNADTLKNAKLAGKMSLVLKGFSGGALTGNGDFDKISPRDEAAAANRCWPGNVSTSRAIILNITQGARLNLSPPRPPSSVPQSWKC